MLSFWFATGFFAKEQTSVEPPANEILGGAASFTLDVARQRPRKKQAQTALVRDDLEALLMTSAI